MAPTIDPLFKRQHPVHDLPTPDPDSPVRPRKPYRFATLCATVENPSQKDQYGSSSVPIYQTATFKGVEGQYDYSRSGNPTRSHLEHHIAKISSATHAFAVSSGMAALDIILRMLKPGDEIITGDDLYGGTNRLLTYIQTHSNIIVHHVDTTMPVSVIPLLSDKTAMVLLESPTNPLLKIVDIARISAMVKERTPNAIVVVDNTMMSPYLQRPLEHGADIVYDSATKYLSGHHDLMAGVVTCNRDDLAKHIAFTINSVGNALTPIDSFLLLRGIKTLAIRLDRQQTTANAVASYLHALGFTTNYPGLRSHPNRELHETLADGPGAVLSFSTGSKAMSERIISGTRLWGISVSFGCVNSLISMPCAMSHASIDAATRAARGLNDDLIRLCVGIEDAGDLLDDLERALLDAGAIKYDESISKFVRVDPRVELEEATSKLAVEEKGKELQPEQKEWFVSAPGKIILFGEHAVVHGVTAVAASLDLRCYGLTTPRNDKKISVHFADINDHYAEWSIAELPWDALSFAPYKALNTPHPDELDPILLDAISSTLLTHLEVPEKRHARTASLAFIYLYMMMARSSPKRPAFNFTARATLPLGAGLGSSASFSVCAATTLCLIFARISIPPPPAPTRRHSIGSLNHIHLSHQGRRALPPTLSSEVNHWSFISEKVLHGNPSGVDNSVAVYGGALAYTRAGFGKPSGMDPINAFRSLKFMLTNSKVPRDTKKLVAGVAEKKAKEPVAVGDIMQRIQSVVDEARRALADPELSREVLLELLEVLISENHGYLTQLGVSHPTLEAIRGLTEASPYKLHTKLTGAGGGGCSLTLLPDEIDDAKLKSLIKNLQSLNFEPYVTSVGGSGLGILSPYDHHRSKVSLRRSADSHPHEGDDDMYATSLRTSFDLHEKGELKGWAQSLGRWLYV